ncbi:MAG: nuclear transport factor 2 family protein [Chloroflexi bacterium]|nr:nuclear transport factor 2 family protein [Chloroflexota bacterium]
MTRKPPLKETEMDLAEFNSAWLRAWSDKDTAKLLTFYHPETLYKDGQVPAGLNGHEALAGYLDNLFKMTPPMEYVPDEVWPIAGGFCGRWICTISLPDGTRRKMRGFDLVLLDGDKITLNEVYTHNLP